MPSALLWHTYAGVTRQRFRYLLNTLGHEGRSFADFLLCDLRLLCEAGGRLHEDNDDITACVIGALLDILVEDGTLNGLRAFGCQRFISVGDVCYFRLVLCERLARGEMWDDLLEEHARMTTGIHWEEETEEVALLVQPFLKDDVSPAVPGLSAVPRSGTCAACDTPVSSSR